MTFVENCTRICWTRTAVKLTSALLLFLILIQAAAAVDDVMLQTTNGKIVTGIVDDNTSVGTLGERVHSQQFLSNFRSANPGFFSLATGSLTMPAGAQGFPANHDVNFDLLPMTIGPVESNLFYWDGANIGGNGLNLSDVNFTIPPGVTWDVFDDNFNMYSATGTDQIVPGGLIQRTSADINPSDGVDTGSMHKHLVLQLSDNDGNSGTSPAQGVYLITWQVRAVGFETSDPFFFVLRTALISNTIRDLAADWVEQQLNLPGDYNQNGAVDAADYALWRDTNGQSGTGLAADGDGNQVVNQLDYDLWRQHFGQTTQLLVNANQGSGAAAGLPSGASVPEPSAATIFFTAVFALAATHRRTRLLHSLSATEVFP